VIPSDVTDEQLDINGRICQSMSAGDTWLRHQTTNGAGLRLDTASGRLDIGFVKLNKTDAQMRGTSDSGDLETGFAFLRDRIERELRNMGHINNPRKVYAVYYGGSTPWSCGGGAWPPGLIGQVAALYVRGEPPGSPPCHSNVLGGSATVPGYFEYSMVHEIMHTIGIVGDRAPNEHRSGHVFDGNVDAATAARDLMYAARSPSDPFWATNDPNGLILDVGRNDYYGHAQSDYPDLARSVFMKPLPFNPQIPPGW
jgi:hypothetical protein